MIAGATRGAGGPALARHLLSKKEGQQVEIMEPRGLASEHLPAQIAELVAAAGHGRTDRPVHHVHIDPPSDCSDPRAVIASYMSAYESEFGLEDSPRCGVYHFKNGRLHAHVVWSLVRGTGRVVDLGHERARREKVSRITEFECFLAFTQGAHNRAVASALVKDGRVDVADAMTAAGLLNGRRPVAVQTPQEHAQSERTSIPIADVRAAALDAWRASDSVEAFSAALAESGFVLARGDRGPILVDRAGGAHGLTRTLSAAARLEGSRITAATVKRRIGNVVLPDRKEAHHDRHSKPSSLAESGASDLPGSPQREADLGATPPPPLPLAGRGGAREPRRDQGSSDDDRRNPRSAFACHGFDPDRRSTRWAQSDRLAFHRLASLDVRALRINAEAISRPPGRRTRRDREAASALSRLDLQDALSKAKAIAAAGGAAVPTIGYRPEDAMAFFRNRNRTAYRQDYKAELLAEFVPDLDGRAWAADIRQVHPAGPSTRPRILTRDGGWVEVDRRTGTVRVWGRPGRAAALAEAIAEAGGWQIEQFGRRGEITARPGARMIRQQPDELAGWWRERGFDAMRADDGVWVDVGGSARLQDIGDRVTVHGTLTAEAARAMVLKAAEAWEGDAELQGQWPQPDQDLIWLEAQRSGVRLDRCTPSAAARAAWTSEMDASRTRDETLALVRATTSPARNLKEAAGGDLAALSRLDPDLRAFVESYLDDEQRSDLAKADVADIVPELRRFRELGSEERANGERERSIAPARSPRREDAADSAPAPKVGP